ncbi:hypothetical protein [Pseudomonas sp. BMS12]|uniref:hypothetical protein n=1 Tax=Pseudomonas sp. BMS12 TaxID=1796033 RepID=UPI000A802FEA|nr:hypothetical protein [Pseudomonas sp. BMS12]
MATIETINGPFRGPLPRLRFIAPEEPVMPIHDFIRSLLAAYAAGASGSYPQELA